MSESSAIQTVTVTDDLLAFANNQNSQFEQKLKVKWLASGALMFLVVGLGVALTFDATELRLSAPVLVDSDGTTKVLPPILDLDNSYEFTAALADKYAMRLMSFHFLKLESQLQSRRSLFVDDETYDRVYQAPLAEAEAFKRIQKNNYIISAATVRNADLLGEFINDGDRYIRYQLHMIQTAQGPSGEPETNTLFLTMTFKRVSRDKAIEGLLISDLGTIRK